MNKVTVFLPCRRGSQRVKNKNVRPFANIKEGLIYIKLSQLLKVTEIEKIVLSTNDIEVKKIAASFHNTKIIIDDRPEELASSTTSTDDLIKYIPDIIKEETILWTHVTSPFVDAEVYQKAINKYFSNLDQFDSLMSVTKLQTFLWNKSDPLNYDRRIEKWPRTQTIKPVYEINSGIFITNINTYKNLNDRIGEQPYLYELNEKIAFDIDWEVDFEIAEVLWRKYGKI
ncbi:MAG: acylneuraminate cytidylyltransferase family protein [Methyloprofundus sp.]|nr:acylneuraminate cytidylyltransferase family protein [Methyloprofundus sp.]